MSDTSEPTQSDTLVPTQLTTMPGAQEPTQLTTIRHTIFPTHRARPWTSILPNDKDWKISFWESETKRWPIDLLCKHVVRRTENWRSDSVVSVEFSTVANPQDGYDSYFTDSPTKVKLHYEKFRGDQDAKVWDTQVVLLSKVTCIKSHDGATVDMRSGRFSPGTYVTKPKSGTEPKSDQELFRSESMVSRIWAPITPSWYSARTTHHKSPIPHAPDGAFYILAESKFSGLVEEPVFGDDGPSNPGSYFWPGTASVALAVIVGGTKPADLWNGKYTSLSGI